MLPLFRKQAIDYQGERLYGELILAQPISFSVLTIFLVTATAIAITFLLLNSYSKKEKVAGLIVPDKGVVSVYSPQQGILEKINVTEGMHVQENYELFSVIIDQRVAGGEYYGSKLMSELESQERNLNSKLKAEKERVDTEISAQENRAKQLSKEVMQLKESIATQNQILEVESGAYERSKRMFSKELIAETEVESAYRTYLSQKQQLQTLEIRLDETITSLDEISTNIASMEVNSRRNILGIESELTELAKQMAQVESQQQIVIKSPIEGRITSVVANVGQQLNPTIPLFSIIPEGSELEANLYISTGAIGFLGVGQTVNIRYDAFPYQKFGTYPGTIKQIAKSVIMPGETPSGLSFQEPVYKVVATLKSQSVRAYGKDILLKPGMVLSADVILDERSLFEWLLEPLYSLRGKI